MWIVAKRSFLDRKVFLAVFSGIAALLSIIYVAFYPFIEDSAEVYAELVSNFPPEVMQVFGMQDATSFSQSLEAFLSVESFSFMWPILLAVLVVVTASAMLAGDIERGTLSLTLSRPISRTGVFLGRALASLASLGVFVAASILINIPTAAVFGIEFFAKGHVLVALLAFFFGFALIGIAFFFSALFSERSHANMAATGVILAMYVLHLLSTIVDSLSWLRFFTFFHYFDYTAALVQGEISLVAIAVFALAGLASFGAGAFVFHRRDIAIS